MIDRDEIIEQSEALSVHTSHIQRDYLHGWLLAGIFNESELADELALKGGNAFRKAYFKNSRYSRDLDFATSRSLSSEFIRTQLNSACDFVSDHTDVQFETERTMVEPTPLSTRGSSIHKARVYFKDFFGEESEMIISIRMDISDLEKIFLDIQTVNLIHQYSGADSLRVDIRVLKLEELLASKLKCLLQRRHSVDLYDFVNATLINPIIEVDRSQMVDTFLRMTIFRSGPRIVEDLLLNLPFQYIKGMWEKYLVAPITAQIDFDNAVDGFSDIVSDIFGNLPVGSSRYAYFPSEYRNPIMQAGHELTMLKVNYQGIPRLVEPYSLKFKQRQDGLAREYLYVYDTTGGRSSGPGIKAFVSNGVKSIENTQREFEPRFEVELSKAGQFFGDRFFRGSPQPFYSPASSKRKHVVLCPTCNKRFYRKKRSSKLNSHKNKYGQKCHTRRGIIIR